MATTSMQFGQSTINVVLNEGQLPAKLSTDASGNTVLAGADGSMAINDAGLRGASPSATAAVNTAAIQAALDVGGVVTISVPGTYEVSSTLVFYSNTHLVLGPDVELKKAASMNAMLGRNANYNSTVVTVSNGVSSTVTGAPMAGYAVATADCGANAHGLSVGDYVLLKGDTTGNYVGVFKVFEVTSSVIFKFLMTTGPSAAFGAGAGTITCAKADANITIEGGLINGNGANNGGAGIDFMGLVFNKVRNVEVTHQRCKEFDKYAYYFCNAQSTFVHNLAPETPSDAIHFNGPCWNSVVKDIRGSSGDDMVAFTTTNAGGYSAYDLPDCDGDFVGIEVDTIKILGSTINRIVLLAAVGGYNYSGVRVSNLFSHAQANFGVMLECQSGETGTYDDVTIDGIRGNIAQTQPAVYVDTAGTKTIDRLTVKNIYPDRPCLKPLVSVGNATATTINSLYIENAKSAQASLFDLVQISGANITIKNIVMKNCTLHLDQANAAANMYMLNMASATINNCLVDGCWVGGSGTTTRTVTMVQVSAPAANARIDITNSRNTDNSQFLYLASVTNTPTITIRGCKTNGQCISVVQQNCNLEIIDVDIVGASYGTALYLNGTSNTYNLYWGRVKNIAGVTLLAYGTTCTYNIKQSDGTLSLKSDTAGQTFAFTKGAVWDDTTATNPGIYCQGPTTTTRIAA